MRVGAWQGMQARWRPHAGWGPATAIYAGAQAAGTALSGQGNQAVW
jgi:hypothetical protein